METTLHQQLKDHYSRPGSRQEVPLGRYRIDVVHRGRLIEIQHSGLGAIRDKIRKLLTEHKVDVVKPLVVRKMLVRLDKKQGEVVSRRWSPHRGGQLDVFQELLHFVTVFPHPDLRLITPLVEVEEFRYPGHGRRRRWGKNDFVVQDRQMTEWVDCHEYKTASDLAGLLPKTLSAVFHTKDLAAAMEIPTWQARQIAWVLRKTGAATEIGKQGNSITYKLASRTKKRLASG